MDKAREIAQSIIEVFENLLEEKGIRIPCADIDEENQRNIDNTATIYGTEYFLLEDEITEILGGN